MQRLPRFRSLAPLCPLVVPCAVLMLWARSYRVVDAFQLTTWTAGAPEPSAKCWVGSDRGLLAAEIFREGHWVDRNTFVPEPLSRPASLRFLHQQRRSAPDAPPLSPNEDYGHWGLSVPSAGGSESVQNWHGIGLTVHYWKAVSFASAAFGASGLLIRWRLRRPLRRTARGQCTKCGYDMRATPNRCPECGSGADQVARQR